MTKATLVVIISIISSFCSLAQPQRVRVSVKSDSITKKYYFSNSLIQSIALPLDSFSYQYKAGRLVKINQYSKETNGKYNLTGDAKLMYGANGRVLDRHYATDFVLPKHECVNHISYLNKLGLLDEDLCYLNSVLRDKVGQRKTNHIGSKGIDTLTYDLNTDVSMKTGADYSPFLYGKVLTKIMLYVSKNRLMAFEGILNEDTAIFHYRKSFAYDREGQLISTKTVDMLRKKTISSSLYSYSKW
ncbi:hypothetical protein [Taibaiella koreensis]|uniref:hypothetical protein n=1 Tax=Taibaiella koreensis TaxID=1268548 RepID=UPI0013C370F7|nr:hypothetical protein [Taibaiella koreensis]